MLNRPVALPRSSERSRTDSTAVGSGSVGIIDNHPLLVSCPVASAVAPAAESVTPSNESVFKDPTAPQGMPSMNRAEPFTRRPISTCSGPMPSPMNRMTFFGLALGCGFGGLPAAGEDVRASASALVVVTAAMVVTNRFRLPSTCAIE